MAVKDFIILVGFLLILGVIGYGLTFTFQYLKKEYRKSKNGR